MKLKNLILKIVFCGCILSTVLALSCSQKTKIDEINPSCLIGSSSAIGVYDNFYSVSFVNPQKGWAVGYYGLIAYTEDGGKTWSRQESNTNDPLFSVKFVDEKNGWIVGKFGRILNTTDGGKTYITQSTNGVKEDLFDVFFVDRENGWSVGTFGTILHTSNGGKSWEKQGEETDKIYNAVFFVDKDHGWIVGEYATILRTKDGGVNWEKLNPPIEEGVSLFDVCFSDKNTGIAVGMDGVILLTKDGGDNWEVCNSPVNSHLFGISIIGNKGWACGLNGSYIYSNDLKNWNMPSQEFELKFWLSDIHFFDEKYGWMVGAHGIIRRTVDGGKTWIERGTDVCTRIYPKNA